MKLREELEEIARGLQRVPEQLRALAARCEPEKPGEAVAEVLEKARKALEAAGTALHESNWRELARSLVAQGSSGNTFVHWSAHGGPTVYLRDLLSLDAALSAIEAYRPVAQGAMAETVARIAEELRAEAAGDLPQCHAPTIEAALLGWAARLESAAVPAAPDEGETSASVVLAAVRDVLIGVQAELGYSKEQGGWYTAMTPGERRVARAVTDIDFWLDLWRSRSPAHASSGEGEGQEVTLGIIELHPKDALREEFYRVVADLRASASIVDLWLMDIQSVLAKHGYSLRVYRAAQEPAPPAPAPSAAGEGEEEEGDHCPNCGERTTFTVQRAVHEERHGLDTPPFESVHQEWLECDKCGSPTDDEEIARANAPTLASCPEVADLKEAIIGAAKEAAREELAAWSRAGEDQPSIFTREDRLFFAACASLQGSRAHPATVGSGDESADMAGLARSDADALLAALAPKPDPTPEELPPARGNAPRSDEEGGGQGEGRAEGGSGLLAPASAPGRCGAEHATAGWRCQLRPGHSGPHWTWAWDGQGYGWGYAKAMGPEDPGPAAAARAHAEDLGRCPAVHPISGERCVRDTLHGGLHESTTVRWLS